MFSLTKLHYTSSISFRHTSKFPLKNPKKYQQTDSIKIGNISKLISEPQNLHLVPLYYTELRPSQSTISHLQWIMKKDILKQDMFLIGLPGPMRARIVLQYLELMQREVEYLVLSRDTTENDIKQRREIYNGTAHYIDQSAVRAALHGRVLILDGIEKVERNVLPVLNNLLENREMQLEDGRFLVAAERYDKLLRNRSKDELDSWRLVRVSEDFRVIALGLPVPQFRGNPLDPPFRSRFQSRQIQPKFDDQVADLSEFTRNVKKTDLKNFLTACHTFVSDESIKLGLPKFPIENISSVVKILDKFPNLPLEHVFQWMYPYPTIVPKDEQSLVLKTLKQFSMNPQSVKVNYKNSNSNVRNDNIHTLEFKVQGTKYTADVSGHPSPMMTTNYISNSYHETILADMLLTHTTHDFCMIGSRGSGKATIVKKFASILNYPVEMVMLYADMTARDLLQQRVTDESGNTIWRASQLVQSAEKGKLLVLDGLHRLHSSTFPVLQRLIHNREMQLYDGTRLLRHDRYDSLKEKQHLSDEEMKSRKIIRIHPAFRIISLAEPPKVQTPQDNWMTPELLSMFLFHTVRPLSLKEEKFIIQGLVENYNTKIDTILDFTHKIRNSEDDVLKNVATSLSTRQLVRMARRLSSFPDESVYDLITQSILIKFLPHLTKQSVESILKSCDICISEEGSTNKQVEIKDQHLKIGETAASIYNAGAGVVKVPDIVFYNSQEHISVMEAMLQDFTLGEHLLLVGNQGVGKNKITDRFLQLLNRPREYIQLHRDTTVQSLTQQPSVRDGKIVYEDSPLLKAVEHGRVLVVDEADKAPTHVTSILRALVVSGEMILSDGRCIIHYSDPKSKDDSNVVVMHPDFRMIVLANRPGFPFLGNDFFARLGDIFSCHAVDNPSLESEISMLKQYGPSVPEYLLHKLANLFGELRQLSDNGVISYPYSTREVVNIVKHLDKFPEEGVPFVLKNVFDFDSYSSELKETLSEIFNKHGIPVEGQKVNVKVANVYNLPKPITDIAWTFEEKSDDWVSKTQNLKCTNPSQISIKKEDLNIADTRAATFSEQQTFYQLPLKHNNIPLCIASGHTEQHSKIYVVAGNPISLFVIEPNTRILQNINLSHFFPTMRSGFRPIIQLGVIESERGELVVLNETVTNQTILIDCDKESMSKINTSSLFEEAISRISNVYSQSNTPEFHMISGFPSNKKIVLFDKNGDKVVLINFDQQSIHQVQSYEKTESISVINEDNLLLKSSERTLVADISNPISWKVKTFKSDFNSGIKSNINLKTIDPSSNAIPPKDSFDSTKISHEKELAIMSNSQDYICLVSGSINNDNILHITAYPRVTPIQEENGTTIVPHTNQIVRFVPNDRLPQNLEIQSTYTNSGYMEVTDIKDLTFSYIEVPLPHAVSSFQTWLVNSSRPFLIMSSTPEGKLLTTDSNGCVRKWEVSKHSLEKSFKEWKKVSGLDGGQQLTIERVSKDPVTAPKHGKIDPTGAPHVGGNTWAGGTGGRDTAGLGGRGGPYRLDAGHNVFQVSDQEKDAVPPEVKKAAREMAMKAYKDRLKEIQMSEYDANVYEEFFSNVRKQVKTLRTILDGLQAKSKERQWMRHQTSGEFDDTKLIEGITGEKSIYKRRGDQEPELGSPQQKPKLLRLVVDVSGSMYRFNGHDNRLQRELESVVLMMEAFDGYQDKFQYEIVGHSGETFCLEFSKFNESPKNDKERLDAIRNMHAHTQFCMSGDNTLEATEHAIRTITDHEADEYFVIVMSDANFDRYGISAKSFGKLLVSNPKVNAFAIFIGSLGDQAAMLSKQLPAGRTFMCFDSADITSTMQKIFTSALLRETFN